ncbi:AIPR family protein [Buchananella felis]|uniref:AIPR family protein n=1 Tax=Buchananella felis TaxID=3231492 RepID=UPI003528F661
MSTFHVRQIATRLQELYPERWDNKHDNEKNLSMLLALYAVDLTLASADSSQVITEITDGGGDQGIDAIGVDQLSHTVVLVQSKWRKDGKGSLSLDGVVKFLDGVRAVLEFKNNTLPSTISKRMVETLNRELEKPGGKIRLVTTTTAKEGLANPQIEAVNRLLGEINDIEVGDPVATFNHIGQGDLYTAIFGASLSHPTMELQLLDWNMLPEPHKSYYGRVNVSEIFRLYREYGEKLFAQNIRTVIPKSEINAGIRDTLLSDPAHLFYYNNGITILAEGIEVSPGGALNKNATTLRLNQASVVNGAQTVSTIGSVPELEFSERTGEAYVMVRCIEIGGNWEDLAPNITRFANTQNQVLSQDFAYLDPEQHRLRGEARSLGLTYLLRAGDSASSEVEEEVIHLREAAIALACAMPDVSYCIAAKREVSRLFGEHYKALFNPATEVLVLVRATQVVRRVSDALGDISGRSTGLTSGIATHARLLIAHLILNEFANGELNDLDADFTEELSKVHGRAVELHGRILSLFPESTYPASFFKNKNSVQSLVDSLRSEGDVVV